jgi:CheY-like chemotaxis protein
VELPALSEEQAESIPPKSPAPHNVSAAPLRVMVVDDHADTARVLGKLLTASGYVVNTATTAAAALSLAGKYSFDLVISDLGLPDMTGYELMKQIKDIYPTKGIAVSGYGMEEDIRKSAGRFQ